MNIAKPANMREIITLVSSTFFFFCKKQVDVLEKLKNFHWKILGTKIVIFGFRNW